MPFDAVVANPGRLRILTALAAEPRQEFVALRRRTALTDGNLSCHARRLHDAGLIAIDKRFREGKPVTELELTLAGRTALEEHARSILRAIGGADARVAPVASETQRSTDDDWID